MPFHRRPSRWLSCWLIAVLLFTQIATAAYACPATTVASQSEVAMAAMPGCEGMPGAMDPNQPQLCQAHCQQGSQTVHPTPASDAPTVAMLLAVLDWRHAVLLPSGSPDRVPPISHGASPPGSPPLYLSLLVLRN